jgi:hypothetical protein
MSDFARALPTREQFLRQVGRTFGTRLPDGRDVVLVLERLDDHVSTPVHQNFSLIFRVPLDMPREQGIFSLTNESLGTIDLFLVPISANAEGLELEAVFNLVTPREHAEARSAEV